MTETPEATYDSFAEHYRDWWAPVIGPSAIRLLDRLDGLIPADAPVTIVDIGSGTGTLALAALGRWPNVRVIGVDPARRLLQMAEDAARPAGVADRLRTTVGEAGRLPLADASVDVAVSTFVLQLVPSRVEAVREALRVLRPGGVFACLVWRSHSEPWAPEDVFDDALDALQIDAPLGPGRSERPYTSPASAAAELRRVGFRSVRAGQDWLIHRFTPQSFLDVTEHWTEEETFATLDDRTRRRLRAEMLSRLGRLHPDELVWRRPLVYAIGRRPS